MWSPRARMTSCRPRYYVLNAWESDAEVLTLLSFCQLSMTCIILDACFPGSAGDNAIKVALLSPSLLTAQLSHAAIRCQPVLLPHDFNYHLLKDLLANFSSYTLNHFLTAIEKCRQARLCMRKWVMCISAFAIWSSQIFWHEIAACNLHK